MTTADTTATALAADAWAMLVRDENPMPPLIARDYVMDGAGCERGEAVCLLACAAADWLQELRCTILNNFNLPDRFTVSGETTNAVREMRLELAAECRGKLTAIPRRNSEAIYDRWVWHAEHAVAILRELLA